MGTGTAGDGGNGADAGTVSGFGLSIFDNAGGQINRTAGTAAPVNP